MGFFRGGRQVRKIKVVSSIALVLGGCVATAWVAAVGIGSFRSSDVEFEPFEASWVSAEGSAAAGDHPVFKTVALMPVDGDEAMGTRLTKLLLKETTLHVVTPAVQPSALTDAEADRQRALQARELSDALAVDAVLYGHVVCAARQTTTWGRKTQESRRLFLYLLDRDGKLVWKDELPFVVVTGTTPAIEASVQRSLARHFIDHVHTLGLDAAGHVQARPS